MRVKVSHLMPEREPQVTFYCTITDAMLAHRAIASNALMLRLQKLGIIEHTEHIMQDGDESMSMHIVELVD